MPPSSATTFWLLSLAADNAATAPAAAGGAGRGQLSCEQVLAAVQQVWPDEAPPPKGLVEFIEAQNGLAKVKDNKIVVRRDWKTDKDKIRGSFSIAQDLAKHARSAKAK